MSMASSLRKVYSRTFLDDMTLGDGEIDDWVDSALSGSGDFVKELLEIGEESLEFSAAEDELRKLQTKLNDAESRESRLKRELNVKNEKISHLEDVVDQLKKELLEERSRAKDEAEDMAQEMAELRYQLTEMLEEERELRARTEQVSVHRVEELEAQVNQARQEVVDALARRRESECRAEKELAELRISLEEARQQLREANDARTVKAANPICEKCPGDLGEIESLKRYILELTDNTQRKEEEVLELRRHIQQQENRGPPVENAEMQEQESVDVETEDDYPKSSNSPLCNVEGSGTLENHKIRHVDALEEKIREIQASEIELQVERCSLLSQVAGLKNQVDRFKHELEVSSELHSEVVLRHEEEKNSLAEEAKLTRDTLSAEISQLQQTLEGQSTEHELARKELVTYQNNLEKEADLSQELTSRIKVLETELQSERALHIEAATKCVDLIQSLDVARQKLFTLESDLDVSNNENRSFQKSLETAESQLLEATKEKHALQEKVQQLNVHLQNQEQRINRLQQELVSQRASNSQLARRVGELNSEVLILQQQLITCQTQVSEMAMKNVILEDTVAAKKRKIKEGEQTIIQQAEKLGRQEEKYFNLQAKFSALQNDFSVLESKLGETRRREQDIRIQVERLSLELNMAKQEVVNSEVRLQKAMKQAKEQLEAESMRHEEVVNKHRQTEWFLNRKIEHLERSEAEKEQLHQEVRGLSFGNF